MKGTLTQPVLGKLLNGDETLNFNPTNQLSRPLIRTDQPSEFNRTVSKVVNFCLVMESINFVKYIILSLLVIAWCVLHSTMISVSVTEYLHKRLGITFRFYRLFFNIVSGLTLLPVVWYASSARTEPIFLWDGYWLIIRLLLLGTAFLLFFLGAGRYDASQFLGLQQIRSGTANKGITNFGKLETSGVLSIIRHPWYLAAILLIWVWRLDLSAIVVNSILTGYLIIGTYLEEKKLEREFGEQYRAYQKRVSMLIPYKWLKLKIMK
jgi:methanethiol S-methyltransferase